MVSFFYTCYVPIIPLTGGGGLPYQDFTKSSLKTISDCVTMMIVKVNNNERYDEFCNGEIHIKMNLKHRRTPLHKEQFQLIRSLSGGRTCQKKRMLRGSAALR